MKMKGKLIKLGILGAVFALFTVLAGSLLTGDSIKNDGHGLTLTRPAFAQTGEASFLEQEAGIAAYVNVGQTIDLTRAKTAYRTIEKETESYIIGSVALPTYSALEDVHVYCHRDGWIVAYYMKDEPTSKMIDWMTYAPGNMRTKMEIGLDIMASSLRLDITDIKYYHFNYPMASQIMIVSDSDSFKITIPTEITLYEKAWFLGCDEGYGITKANQLQQGISHEVKLHAWGQSMTSPGYSQIEVDGEDICSLRTLTNPAEFCGIVLVYRE